MTRQLSNTINTKGSRYISYTQKAIDYLKEFNGDPKQMDRNKIGTYWSSSIVCTEFPNLVHFIYYNCLLKSVIIDTEY